MTPQNQIPDNPRIIGLPHDTWRPNQRELAQSVLNTQLTGGGKIFAEAAVGFGKSSVAAALGKYSQITVHVHTLSLLDQYRDNYDFAIIKGRQEYLCVLDDKVETWKAKYNLVPTARDCHFPIMYDCPAASSCPYLIAKDKGKKAPALATTYKYGALALLPQSRNGILILDEAHAAAEELIKFNEFILTHKRRDHYSLPPFPFNAYGEKNLGDVLTGDHINKIIDWFTDCIAHLGDLDEDPITKDGARITRVIKSYSEMRYKLRQCDWFLLIESARVVLKALTAKHVADRLFAEKSTILAMSGTIGDPAPLAFELGIDEYNHIAYDHPIPVANRPVHNLHVKPMNYNNLNKYPSLYRVQAIQIANFIKSLNPEWRGLILSSSFYKIQQLGKYLPELLDNHRFFIQGVGKTPSQLVAEFTLNTHPGDIAIATIQGLGTGVDFYGDLARYVVIAGVPHPSPTDKYMMARRERHGGIAYQHFYTFSAIAQGLGRVTRGEVYDDMEYQLVYATYQPIHLALSKNYPNFAFLLKTYISSNLTNVHVLGLLTALVVQSHNTLLQPLRIKLMSQLICRTTICQCAYISPITPIIIYFPTHYRPSP